MLRVRRNGAYVACVAGLLLIGCGFVRAADPTHAEFSVPARASIPWTSTLWESLQAPPPTVAESSGASAVGLPPVVLPTPPRLVEHTQRPPLPVLKPVRIELPTLGTRAPIVPVAVSRDGALTVPEDPQIVGWWAGGGDTLVLDGHVDTAAQGPGALFHLIELTTGDAVRLTGADGVVRRFTVTQVHAYPKATLPSDVFRSTTHLVIITCGGRFDRHRLQYDDNIVAFAEPAS
jgi:hypothetical protein